MDNSSYNCALTVNIAPLSPDIRRMAIALNGFSVAASEQGRHPPVEEDIIVALLHDAFNHYVTFVLSHGDQHGVNIGFDYYLEEYFPSFADFVKGQQGAVNMLGSMFAGIVGALANSLKPGMDRLDFHGQDITDITSIVLCPGKTQMYILEGNSYCLDDNTPI